MIERLRTRGTAKLLRDFAAVRVVLWVILIGPSLVFQWANSVAFVSVLSILALVLSDLAVWQAGRAEVQAAEISVEADNADVQANNVTVEETHV